MFKSLLSSVIGSLNSQLPCMVFLLTGSWTECEWEFVEDVMKLDDVTETVSVELSSR